MMKISIGIFLSFCLLLNGCNNTPPNAPTDTPVRGKIKLSVDESLYPLADAEIKSFETDYKDAHFNPTYTSESEAFNDLLKDTARVIIVSRPLSEKEKDYFKKKQLTVVVNKIAIDGIALLVNNKNADSTFTYNEFKSIFSGKITEWKQLKSSLPSTKIEIVFDNRQSSIATYMSERLHLVKTPDNWTALNSDTAVLNYVQQHENAIGVTGVGWVSETADSLVKSFQHKVKVVGISSDSTGLDTTDYLQPFQDYIALKTYPLRRNVYIISHESYVGLGTGFVNYIMGDNGQKIVRLLGLLPGNADIHIVVPVRTKNHY